MYTRELFIYNYLSYKLCTKYLVINTFNRITKNINTYNYLKKCKGTKLKGFLLASVYKRIDCALD